MMEIYFRAASFLLTFDNFVVTLLSCIVSDTYNNEWQGSSSTTIAVLNKSYIIQNAAFSKNRCIFMGKYPIS